MTIINNISLILLIAVCTAGCSTSDIGDATLSSSTTAALPILVTGYGSAYLGKAGYQNSSIALNLPDKLYAKEIQATPVNNFQDCSFVDIYKYMGSKDDYHYIMHYPTLGLRNVLKISKTNFDIQDEFPLTSLSKKWTDLNLSHKYNFFDNNGYIFNIDNQETLHDQTEIKTPDISIEDWIFFDEKIEILF